MTHHVPVPDHPQPPVCACGWTPALPWRCCWEQWDADVAAHLRSVTPGHQHNLDDAADRCPTCQEAGRG